MTANELQIGDWVKVVPFHNENNSYNKRVENGSDIDRLFDFQGHIEPIPITQKILDKNGFRDMWMTNGNVLEIGKIFINYDKNNGHIFIMRNSEDVLDAHNIRFVHQLQHVLRMCEIDKEIEL